MTEGATRNRLSMRFSLFCALPLVHTFCVGLASFLFLITILICRQLGSWIYKRIAASFISVVGGGGGIDRNIIINISRILLLFLLLLPLIVVAFVARTSRSRLFPRLGMAAAPRLAGAAVGLAPRFAALAGRRRAKETVVLGSRLTARFAAPGPATPCVTVVVVQQSAALGMSAFAVPGTTGDGKGQEGGHKQQKGGRQEDVCQ